MSHDGNRIDRAIMAAPNDANVTALYVDMRALPRLKSLSVSCTSNQSMPSCQPKAYSHKVAAPSNATNTASTSETRRALAAEAIASASESPHAISATAVLAFISTAPGMTLRSVGESLAQPASTVQPRSAEMVDAAATKPGMVRRRP